jgi:nucleotide-binding universal stress UspA family protein
MSSTQVNGLDAKEGCMSTTFNKILCPTDFSASSERALDFALAIGKMSGAQLLLLHVVEPLSYPASSEYFDPVIDEVELTMQMGAALQKQLEDQVTALKQNYEAIQGKVVSGNTFLEIINAVRDAKIDLIVMGTHGRTGLAHVLIGSVAEKVVREAPCPVLTVKHPEHEFVRP